MPGIDFRALRDQVPLARLLELLDFVPVSRRGAEVRGRCPVHGSRTRRSRSFAAHLQWQCWHCFRCGAGGNALDLWVAVTKLPLYEAALDLCRRLALDVPWLPPSRRRPTSRSPPGCGDDPGRAVEPIA
jgi:DNA primase